MANIILGNVNQDSPIKQAHLDLVNGVCTLDGGLEIKIGLLARMSDFNHPLLTQSSLSALGNSYCYEYDNFEGLLQATRYIYATLIQSNTPQDCEFKITPSVKFVRLKNKYKIPFSIHHRMKARELLELAKFNSMISRFNGFNFQYQDTISLEKIVTLKTLPSEVNADLLYETNPDIMQFCQQEEDFNKFEIRYINRFIGFGTFARKDIAEGELLAQYCGLKEHETAGAYVFGRRNDALNLRINAMHYGNIARFINHAPQHLAVRNSKLSRKAQQANIEGEFFSLYGNDIVIYRAQKNIAKGEQLLMDYGDKYFTNKDNLLLIHCNGTILNSANKKIKESRQQKHHSLQLMSQHGSKYAQWLLFAKPLLILLGIIVFTLFHR